jgi:hypothetical protein
MMTTTCRRAREAWSESFDLGQPLPREAETHLAVCAGCAEFARGAEQVRSVLSAIPAPAPDAAADRLLLEALHSAPVAPQVNLLVAWLASLWSPAAPRLAAAGAAGFIVTVGVAAGITALCSGDPGSTTAPSAAGSPERRGYLVNRIDLWAGPDAIPQRRAPAPAPRPEEPRTPGQPRGRANITDSLSALG